MLSEIRCDEFQSDGKVREPIKFHKGLNAVVGNESGTNSVGKSTFLMILDFVFGGEDYIKKSKEVQRYLDPHVIQFKFEFDGKPYYFSRSTEDYNKINICDENYIPLKNETMTVSAYGDWLKEMYGLNQYGATWRGIVGRFIRVDRRENLDEEKPFKTATRETDAQAIINIIKLYDRYEGVEVQEKAKKEADDRETAFKAAQKYDYIPKVRSKKEYKDNEEMISILEVEVRHLAEESAKGLLDLDSMQAEELKEIRSQLSKFKRQRTKLNAELDIVNRSKEETRQGFVHEYNELLEYFPSVNVEKLERVENFHRNLTKILRSEIKDSADDIEAMIELTTQQIDKLENQAEKISKIPNVTQAILDKYADIKKRLQILVDANAAYDTKEKLTQKAESEKEILDRMIVEQLNRIDSKLNTLMDEMNQKLYSDPDVDAPLIQVKNSESYILNTPSDGSAGIRYKGLILFDLAVLQTSNLPFIVHDSVLLLQIDNEVLDKILQLYEDTDKQVFISFDKVATPLQREILDEKRVGVLHLSRDGNELFGRRFNKKSKAEMIPTEG